MKAAQMRCDGIGSQTILATFAGLALLVLTPAPASAGFDWTPAPAEEQAPAAEPQVDPLPEDALMNGPLTPEPNSPQPAPVEPVEEAAAPDLPVPQPAPAPEPEMVAAPAPEPEPAAAPNSNEVVWAERTAPAAAPAAQTAPVPTSAFTQFDPTPVEGFGKDIPLAIALRQIAPAKYAYKFTDGVSPGQKVSWDGGKAWPEVMSDMLSASGLQIVVQNNVITVSQAGAPPQTAGGYSRSASDLDEPTPLASSGDNAPVAPSRSAQELEASARADVSRTRSDETTYHDTAPVNVAAVGKQDNVPVVDIKNRRRWEARPGATLRETLEAWGRSAGTEVEWMTPYDYPITNSFSYQGRFDQAVDSLLSLYAREEQRPRGRLYPNLPEGPSVLMVN